MCVLSVVSQSHSLTYADDNATCVTVCELGVDDDKVSVNIFVACTIVSNLFSDDFFVFPFCFLVRSSRRRYSSFPVVVFVSLFSIFGYHVIA